MKLLLSCKYNMDTACVELCYSDGSSLALECIEVEHLYGSSPAYRTELDYLIYNDPPAYADLILTGDVEAYLRTAAQERYLD